MKSEIGMLYQVGSKGQMVYPANGKKFSLLELQGFVGGYIEHVPFSRPLAYCNEEGRLNNLPVNAEASKVFKQELVGDVIQVLPFRRSEGLSVKAFSAAK
jgi:uncharacterized protein DUF3846